MAGITGAMMTIQVLLLATLITIAVSGAMPENQKDAAGPLKEEAGVDSILAKVPSAVGANVAPAGLGNRAKRRAGWGRRPGLRYSKATSVFDVDNLFNKIYNKYEKRGQAGPEAPISNFRELRMKQKVPNVQLLLPHLFNRNNRVPPPGALDMDTPLIPGSGSDLGILDVEGGSPSGTRLTDEDVDALMFLLEDYAQNLRSNGPNDQQ